MINLYSLKFERIEFRGCYAKAREVGVVVCVTPPHTGRIIESSVQEFSSTCSQDGKPTTPLLTGNRYLYRAIFQKVDIL